MLFQSSMQALLHSLATTTHDLIHMPPTDFVVDVCIVKSYIRQPSCTSGVETELRIIRDRLGGECRIVADTSLMAIVQTP